MTGIPSWQSWKASVTVAENTILKSVGARTQPCFTPFDSLLESILTRLRHVQNFNHYAFVKLSYGRYEFAGTAKLLLCRPQAVSAYRIEGLGQVSKGHKEVAILLMAFFTYSRVGNFGQSVILQVKGELNHFYWSRSVRYFLSSK